jgi:hypothetical protein
MTYSMRLCLTLATALTTPNPPSDPPETRPQPPPDLDDLFQPALDRLHKLIDDFRSQPVTPQASYHFEHQLQAQLRLLGRCLVQWTYNHLEPDDVRDLPACVHFQHDDYRRLNAKTPQQAWTLFGQIRLLRSGYRAAASSGEPTLFPLALALGLQQGASAALAARAAHLLGEAGMTQQRTLARLRQDHGVGWGVKKLRQVTAAVSAALSQQRQTVQVEQLLDWLAQATASTGKHKPLLSVGRDGITLGLRIKGGALWEVATTATVSVLDRQGKRLGTVYLAYTPQPGQATLTTELTALLEELWQRWQGPLPRLCYVTDAGDNETGYYERVLRRQKHPRTHEELVWLRVVDYYHASTRLWTLAEQLFGKGQRAASWVRKMQKWLLKDGGVNRVLHSAAALRQQYGLRGQRAVQFTKAYRYLRERMRYMRYGWYRRLGVPLGSGVTEAGCKTVYGQRMKLSGMRWQKAGAQVVLNLRVLQLSGVWCQAYERVLQGFEAVEVRGQSDGPHSRGENAA